MAPQQRFERVPIAGDGGCDKASIWIVVRHPSRS
jgi:hypothetical protein